MLIEIEEDYEQDDGGYAILTLSKSIGEADGSIKIKRLVGEPDKLGPNGWQPHEAVLKPCEVRNAGSKSQLYFGPELTEYLTDDTELEITVLDLNHTERVIWPYVTPSVHADGGRGEIGGVAPGPGVDTPVNPGGPTGEPPFGGETGRQGGSETGGDLTGGGMGGETGGDRSGGGTGGETGGDPTGDGTGGDPIGPGGDDEKTGFNWLWLIPIAAVLAVIGYFVFPIFTDTSEPDEIVTEETITDEPEVIEETDIVQNETEVVEEAEDETVVTEVNEVETREELIGEASQCLEDGCEGEVFFDIATRLGAIGGEDLFAIMGLAADRGSVSAMEWLAQSYDPLYFEEGAGLSNPDPDSAFLYYKQAADAGSEVAAPAQEALCAALAAPDDAGWTIVPSEDDIRSALERNCQ